MTDINDEYCNLKKSFKQHDEDSEFIQIDLTCQLTKIMHNKDKTGFHLDSKYIEHDDNTTILHIQWSTIKTEELR